MTAEERPLELTRIAATAAMSKDAENVVAYDVSDQLAITDVFMLCSVHNEPQMRTVIDEIEDRLRDADAKPTRREGEREGNWVLLDFVDIVVHIQQAEDRDYYGLDRLWRDCPQIELS